MFLNSSVKHAKETRKNMYFKKCAPIPTGSFCHPNKWLIKIHRPFNKIRVLNIFKFLLVLGERGYPGASGATGLIQIQFYTLINKVTR